MIQDGINVINTVLIDTANPTNKGGWFPEYNNNILGKDFGSTSIGHTTDLGKVSPHRITYKKKSGDDAIKSLIDDLIKVVGQNAVVLDGLSKGGQMHDSTFYVAKIVNKTLRLTRRRIVDGYTCDVCGCHMYANGKFDHLTRGQCKIEEPEGYTHSIYAGAPLTVLSKVKSLQFKLVPCQYQLYVPDWVVEAWNIYSKGDSAFAGMPFDEFLTKMSPSEDSSSK